MEEGVAGKRTIFVGNLADDTNESELLAAFSTFGLSR
jgi:RNA recognition motif-containing protein